MNGQLVIAWRSALALVQSVPRIPRIGPAPPKQAVPLGDSLKCEPNVDGRALVL